MIDLTQINSIYIVANRFGLVQQASSCQQFCACCQHYRFVCIGCAHMMKMKGSFLPTIKPSKVKTNNISNPRCSYTSNITNRKRNE